MKLQQENAGNVVHKESVLHSKTKVNIEHKYSYLSVKGGRKKEIQFMTLFM